MKVLGFKAFTDVKILEDFSRNDRSLISYYDPTTKRYGLILFNLYQVNKNSLKSPLTTWGYITGHVVSSNLKEHAEVVGLYLQDMEKDNFWWEFDGKTA